MHPQIPAAHIDVCKLNRAYQRGFLCRVHPCTGGLRRSLLVASVERRGAVGARFVDAVFFKEGWVERALLRGVGVKRLMLCVF